MSSRNHPSPRPGAAGTHHYFTPQPLVGQPLAGQPPSGVALENVRWTAVQARGHTLQMATGAGVFARSGLDAGSRLLLETATFPDAARLCDLGCGWGAIGCFAAALAPDARVALCDINLRAVALARLNLRHNALANATAWCGDGLGAVGPATFDAVYCNPPVRAGNAVIARLFDDAHRCLAPGGALWVVLRTAQGAKSWQRRLAALFGACQTVALDGGYRIFRCDR